MRFSARLERHMAQRRVKDDSSRVMFNVPVDLKQYRIYVRQVDEPGAVEFMFGYVGVNPGSPINGIVTIPNEMARNLIIEEIKQELLNLNQAECSHQYFAPSGNTEDTSWELGKEPDDEEEYEEDESEVMA